MKDQKCVVCGLKLTAEECMFATRRKGESGEVTSYCCERCANSKKK